MAQPSELQQRVRQESQPPRFWFDPVHDLRGIHSTALLDADIPVHIVAKRLGDDPAILPRNYVKPKRSANADKKLAEAIAGLAAGFHKR